MKITSVDVHDLRFPTSSDLSGSDAVHKDPDYSCVYVVLHTDDAAVPAGYGLTFTLGRGNEVVAACVRSLDYHLIGADFDADIVADMTDAVDHRGFYYRLCQDGQMRWLGPEKGVVALACGAIMNAVWDIMARRANKPVWLLVAEMEPERLVELIDFKHIADFVSKDEALALLKRVRPGWEQRVERMKTVGFRACECGRGGARARARGGGEERAARALTRPLTSSLSLSPAPRAQTRRRAAGSATLSTSCARSAASRSRRGTRSSR